MMLRDHYEDDITVAISLLLYYFARLRSLFRSLLVFSSLSFFFLFPFVLFLLGLLLPPCVLSSSLLPTTPSFLPS